MCFFANLKGQKAMSLHGKNDYEGARKLYQEAYEAGEFATGYSGADRQATSYYFVTNVLSIEKSYAIQF